MGQSLCRNEMLGINILNCTAEWAEIIELNRCSLMGFFKICHFALKITLRLLSLCCLVVYIYTIIIY